MFDRLLGWYTESISWAVAPGGILPGAKFTFRPSLAFSYMTALLHGTPAAGVSQTLRRGTRHGITELSQMAPPVLYSAGRPSR